MLALKLWLNGQPVTTEVAPATLLIDWLRGPQALTGTHAGCDTAQCGACTVLIDGQAVKSCSLLAVQAAGCQVTTVEGLASACLLAQTAQPTEAQIVHALEGNLCRCTGYVNIVAAVQQAAAVMAGAKPGVSA